MSYKIIFTFSFALLFVHANAQIPNQTFESWTNFGNYEDPDGWGTINSLTSLIGAVTVTKATGGDAHSGTYAMKLESKAIPSQGTAPGIAATGTINPSSQAVDGGVAFNERPYAITGWYKYQPGGVDAASVDVLLFKWDSTAQHRVIVGQATFEQTATVSSYTQFGVAFDYQSADLPDTMVITILTSSGGGSSPAGSVLFIDDLAFADSLTGIGNLGTLAEAGVNIFPNPAQNVVTIELRNEETFRFRLFDAKGTMVKEEVLSSKTNTLSLREFPAGNYIVELQQPATGKVFSGKLMKE